MLRDPLALRPRVCRPFKASARECAKPVVFQLEQPAIAGERGMGQDRVTEVFRPDAHS